MRRLAIAIAIVTVTGGAILLACSSDNSSPPASGNDGGSSSGSPADGGSSGNTSAGDGNVQNGDDFAAIDGGCVIASSVTCKLHCTGYQFAGTLASTPRTDAPGGSGIAWTNVDNAKTQDGQFATVTLNDGEESASLDATNFGFTLDDSKATYGVAVEFTREAVSSVFDAHFTLIVENPMPQPPVDHQDDSIWPETQIGTHHYGQCVDTWELNLNPVDVRKPTFGARISVKRGPDAGAGPVTANVDSMRVNVCYCNADGS